MKNERELIEKINSVKNGKLSISEIAITGSNNILQAFKMNIYDGKGLYETGVNRTFWSSLIISAKILMPQNGIWTIKIRDLANKGLIIYTNSNVFHDEEISFNYKTGMTSNFLIEATWDQCMDTILSGEISIRY